MSWDLSWAVQGPAFMQVNKAKLVNTLRPRQNGRHFADDIFKWISLNENVWILIKISLKFVPQGPINNITALVQIKAWRRPGDKPLSQPMKVRLQTHICVTQWINMFLRKYICVCCYMLFGLQNVFTGITTHWWKLYQYNIKHGWWERARCLALQRLIEAPSAPVSWIN